MKRRLELARVLLHEPEILIMDEPSRGIDAPTQRRIWEQLLELRRARRMTILLTTHQPDEAEHCDRLAVLDHGRVIAVDTPDALRHQVGGDVITL
jgi:ABC-2 type transport system ATP-binding protein